MVVCEVPEARLSANDIQLILMKSISILKYTSTYLQQVDKQDCLLNQSSKSDHLPSQGGLRDEHLPIK